MGKQKYAVEYTEVYRKIFLVEADSPEEAEEKMEYAAENIPLDMDNCFDHWDIAVITNVTEEEKLARKKGVHYFDPLPEE